MIAGGFQVQVMALWVNDPFYNQIYGFRDKLDIQHVSKEKKRRFFKE
jgi:hypothetical protein